MNTWYIKGLCEECGFAYKGTISSKDTSFPEIRCQNCHHETINFDESYVIDKNNKDEGTMRRYINLKSIW